MACVRKRAAPEAANAVVFATTPLYWWPKLAARMASVRNPPLVG